MKRRATTVAMRVPYPQTPDTAAQWCKDNGVTVVSLARANGLHRSILVDLLLGKLKGNYGRSHLGAIVLGLKPEPNAEQPEKEGA